MIETLRQRNFFIYWMGGFVSFTGTWLQGTAFQWIVRDLTPSPFQIQLVGFCSSIPMFFLSIFGGVLADRLDRRKVIMLAQLFLCSFASVMAYLIFSSKVSLTYLYIFALATGTAVAVDAPLRQSFVQTLVAKESLASAIALNSTSFNVARIIGPAFAGVIIAWFGKGMCFAINAVSFLAVFVALIIIRVDSSPRRTVTTSLLHDLHSGFRYIKQNRTTLGIILLVAIPSVFSFPYYNFMTIFARDILHLGEKQFGILLSSGGVGAAIGALTVTRSAAKFGRGKLLLGALLLLGCSLNILAFSTEFWISSISLFLNGIAGAYFFINANSILQLISDEKMTGRVLGAYVFTSLGLSPLGNLVVGAFAGITATATAVSVGGIVALIAGISYWKLRPDIRNV